MFTDMVGYTALGQRNESLSLALVEEQRKLVRTVLSRHNGREIKTVGDAFLVEFPNALDAVRCAYDIQRAAREFNMSVPEGRRIHLRVGVHLGDVEESQNDISGDAVNVASRIEPLAEDDGVCITQQVYDHVHNKIEFPLTSIGRKSLKNVAAPLEIYRMVMPWEEKEKSSKMEADKNRIAVLPFTNMSPDPQDEYFADGMTEELISTISGMSELSVISRTSAMRYKGSSKSVEEIGRELKVGVLLEGSVRKAENTIRITAQLIDVDSDKHIWAQSYDRELRGVFAIQTDIANKIAEALKVRLAPGTGSVHNRPGSIEAYTLYLKGRSLWNRRDKEGILASLKLFQDAIKIDPGYARAYSGLADAYFVSKVDDLVDLPAAFARSKEAALKALELDDTLAEAHASLGNNLISDWRWEEGIREFRKAIELNPSYASAHQWYSLCLQNMGSKREATEEIEKAHELDPLSPVITENMGVIKILDGRFDEAIAIFDRLIEIEPAYLDNYLGRSFCYALEGMKEKAYADLEAWHRLRQDEDRYKYALTVYDLWFGERERAPSLIEELISKVGKSPVIELNIAECYAILGDRDEFFKWVDKAIAEKRFLPIYPANLRYSPLYDKVRDDPRFPETFKKVGLPY
jgi:adenylate cyclase